MLFRTQNYNDHYAKVSRSKYPDGSIKLTVIGRYGQPLCVPTVCLRDLGETPQHGYVFIAEYGETAGSLHALQNAGVIARTNRVIDTATRTTDPLQRRAVHECRLLTVDV